jgi:probable phosphoglycerate mutase
MLKNIFILRHGETENNRLAIVQGSGIDGSLNETGQLQAQAFYLKYQHLPFELVVTSTLQRTHQTVKGFIDKGIPWVQLSAINEMNWGVHEGKSYTTWMEQPYKQAISDWQKGIYETRLEAGESAAELAARLAVFMEWLHGRTENNILICSHGRAMRCMMTYFFGLPVSDMEKFSHKNTGVYHFLQDKDGFNPILINDISHLNLSDGFPVQAENR